MNLALTHNRSDYEKECIENMLRKQISGLILIPSLLDDWEFYYKSFTSCNKPLILLDRSIKSLESGYISFNYEETFFQLTSDLIQSGKKRIILITESAGYSCEAECLNGYRSALLSQKLPFKNEYVISSLL